MRSWSGVNVVVTDVAAIASLLLDAQTGLPVCGVLSGWFIDKRLKDFEVPARGLTPMAFFSTLAFQLLTIGNLA
jgi:hypothetical protein